MYKRRAWRSKTLAFCGLAAALVLGVAVFLRSFRPTNAAATSSVDYTYIGNVGNTVPAWSQNGDLVNPTMIEYANVTDKVVYVFCNSTDMPYGNTGELISAQANPNNYRTIVIFHDNGDGTFTYKSMVTIEIAGAGYSFSNNMPQGMTVSSSQIIYMTAPTNALVAAYQADINTPTIATPTFIGPLTGANGYTGSVLGVPSIDQANGHIMIAGTFNGGSSTGYASYGVAHLDPTSPTAATDIPMLLAPYNANGNTYYVQNVVVSPGDRHLASGYFNINNVAYNVVQVDESTGAITPAAPPNITGVNDPQDSASIYGITSINSDSSGNIYLSGSFGVNNNGQYTSSALLKLDQDGNFVTDIAPLTNTSSTTGQLSGLNMVHINTANQWVFVVDTANSAGAAVRVFAFNGTLPGSGNSTPTVSIPPSSVNLNTNTGTVFATPPTGGGVITITNRESNGGCDLTQPAVTTLIVNLSDISNGVPINTSIVDPNTGVSIATSFVVYPNGSTTMALTTGSDGTTVSGNGTPTTNNGITTATINLTAQDGTTLTNTVTTGPNASGGTTIHSVKTITQPDGYTSTTVIRVATTATGAIDLSFQFPNITNGDNYCASVTANNGSGSSSPITIPWTAGNPEPSVSLSQVYCSTDEFNIVVDPTPGGALGTACATITTATNNPTGFTTTLSTDNANLTCSADSGEYYLTPISDPGGAIANNQWGYYLGTGSPYYYTAVPTVASIIQYNTGSTVGDSSTFWIGAQVDYSQPPCTYTGTMTMTASANVVPAPTVTSISPTSGSTSGSTPITVTGTNFGTTDVPYITEINVGGTSCLFFAVLNNASATCIAPPLAAGTYDLQVVGYGGAATLPGSFTYN